MDARERDRLAAARTVSRELRLKDFRPAVPVRDQGGRYPVVVALMDDTLGYVFDRVADLGGACNVAVPSERGTTYIGIEPLAATSVPVVDEERCQVHRGTEVGMLLTLLSRFATGPLVLSMHPEAQLHLLEDGRRDPVDA